MCVLLLVYFGLQTLIRTWLSGTVDLDESEQLILTQKFSWGYGSQPPLYTWIQMFFFKLCGVSVLGLALLKNLLLFCIYLFTYLNVRFVTRSHVCGVLGAVSLLFIPQVSWESQRDLTHSVLATAWVTVTLFVFLRLRKDSWLDYGLFGICAGLGILSKYNYLAFLFGLTLAALSVERFRLLISNRRLMFSMIVALVILSPHLKWAMENQGLLSTTAYKFRPQTEHHFFAEVRTGFANLFVAVLFHVGPILGIFLVVFRSVSFDKRVVEKNEYARLFLRKYGLILAGLILVILIFRITGFKDRWFEPIFISVPLLVFAVARSQVNATHAKAILVLGSVVIVLVLGIIPGRILLAEKIGRTQLLNAPYLAMKEDLAKVIPSTTLVVAENKWVGGNLRLLFPTLNVVTPELAQLYATSNRTVMAVWDASRRDAPSRGLNLFVEGLGMRFDEQTEFVAVTYQFHRAKAFRLGLAPLQRNGEGH